MGDVRLLFVLLILLGCGCAGAPVEGDPSVEKVFGFLSTRHPAYVTPHWADDPQAVYVFVRGVAATGHFIAFDGRASFEVRQGSAELGNWTAEFTAREFVEPKLERSLGGMEIANGALEWPFQTNLTWPPCPPDEAPAAGGDGIGVLEGEFEVTVESSGRVFRGPLGGGAYECQ